jgi:hypothetical protein
VTSFLCKACGTQFPESDEPPAECPICSDERQYGPSEGQQWVTYDHVRSSHCADIREEQPKLTGIDMKPEFGIGQRALLVESRGGLRDRDLTPALLLDDGRKGERVRMPGGQVLHWRSGNALLSGDIVQVPPGARRVSFMYSYPMLLPPPVREVERIVAALAPWEFERIYGAWWGRVVAETGKDVVRRSAERYVRALA